MKRKLLSLLVLLMMAATGAWAQGEYLYLDNIVNTNESKTATLMCSASQPDDKPYFYVSGWDDTYYTGFNDFKSRCTKITVDASCQNFYGSSLVNLFSDWDKLETINNISNLNTFNVYDMSLMFSGCHALKTLDLSGWGTKTFNVKYMTNMFSYCYVLETLDLSGWDTSIVEDMQSMFKECYALSSLNLTGWDTSNVTNSDNMFYACYNLNKTVTAKEGAPGEYWATFYDVCNYQAPSGTRVFAVNLDTSKDEITMIEITDGIIKSSEGVVLKSTSSSIALTPTFLSSDYSDNSLKGTTTIIWTSTSVANDYYVLNKGTKGIGFYKLKTGGSIGANKAYLTYSAGAREFIGFGNTTSIQAIDNGQLTIDNVVYDLQGRRVSQPTKGLYIVNGKKVVVK